MNHQKTRPARSRPLSRALDPVRSAPGLVVASLLGTLALPLAVGATVIPTEELEANKPQIQVSKSGNNLILDWTAHPDVYYFVEGIPDLNLMTWIPAKLLKDNAEAGTLSLGTAMSSSKGFFRLSLEGDPGSSRLRLDDDGDGIINLLEADAGWDAFLAEDPVDTDADGIPDYFEQFHFGTLAHDADYVATTGGLTLSEAYAAATNPNVLDSDGDGISDAKELERDSNPNNSLSPPYDFKETDNGDGTTTYTWRSNHGTGDFSVQEEQPQGSGNWVQLFSVPYSSLAAPTGDDRYTVTVDASDNVIPQ